MSNTNRHSFIAGSNAPFIVQLYPVDSDSGSNGINLTGATSFSAKATKVDGTGSGVAFTTVSVSEATAGKVKLEYGVSTFAVGAWYVQIQFTDSAGDTHIYPSEGNNLLMTVKEQIT